MSDELLARIAELEHELDVALAAAAAVKHKFLDHEGSGHAVIVHQMYQGGSHPCCDCLACQDAWDRRPRP